METTKAKFLNKYLLTCIQVFDVVLHQIPLEDYEIEGELVNFEVSDFENYYNDFRKELEVVILETTDISIALDYLETCFNDIIYWSGFHADQNKVIFSLGYEVNFLITLKRNIEKYSNIIKGFCLTDNYGNQIGLSDFFYILIESNHLSDDVTIPDLTYVMNGENQPVFDIRFDYENMKAECDDLKSTQEMILFIHDRINYLKQWQIQYDSYQIYDYKYSPYYYPNFENLCKMELERLDKKLELEKKLNIPSVKTIESKPSENEPSKNPYIWNSSNNDLVELVTAIYQINALKRKDGEIIYQNELIDYFEELFNKKIGNDKATRAYITDPLTTRPLFIEKLNKGFNQYRDSKTEKKPDIIKTRKTGY